MLSGFRQRVFVVCLVNFMTFSQSTYSLTVAKLLSSPFNNQHLTIAAKEVIIISIMFPITNVSILKNTLTKWF